MSNKLLALCTFVAACGNSGTSKLADSGGGDGGRIDPGSGVPEPCAIDVTSTPITGSTGSGSGSCTAPLVNNTTFAIDFVAADATDDSAMSEIACTITPSVVPQTLGFRQGTTGCTIEIDENKSGNGIVDSWDATAASTVDIVLTDLAPVSGTIHLVIENEGSETLTVTGTF